MTILCRPSIGWTRNSLELWSGSVKLKDLAIESARHLHEREAVADHPTPQDRDRLGPRRWGHVQNQFVVRTYLIPCAAIPKFLTPERSLSSSWERDGHAFRSLTGQGEICPPPLAERLTDTLSDTCVAGHRHRRRPCHRHQPDGDRLARHPRPPGHFSAAARPGPQTR